MCVELQHKCSLSLPISGPHPWLTKYGAYSLVLPTGGDRKIREIRHNRSGRTAKLTGDWVVNMIEITHLTIVNNYNDMTAELKNCISGDSKMLRVLFQDCAVTVAFDAPPLAVDPERE